MVRPGIPKWYKTITPNAACGQELISYDISLSGEITVSLFCLRAPGQKKADWTYRFRISGTSLDTAVFSDSLSERNAVLRAEEKAAAFLQRLNENARLAREELDALAPAILPPEKEES